jgi:O-antigen/teichoic acid export membrane protein
MQRASRNRKAVASAGFGVTQRLVQVGSTLILMPVLLHALGTAGFGVWGAAASLAWLAPLADFGSGSALVTLVAREMALERVHEARRQIAAALTLSGALALVFLALIATVWELHPWGTTGAVYLIGFAGLAVNLPLNSANNIWMALQEGYFSSAWEFVQTVMTTVALIAATFYTKDVRVFVALVYGGVVAANLGSLTHLWLRHPELRPERLPERWPAMRELAGSGMMFFLMGLAGGLSYMLDSVLALQLLGAQAAAQMTIAMRICVSSVTMMVAISQPLWPAFADAAHTADRQWVMHKLEWGTALLTGITFAGALVLVAWGEPLMRLWLHANLAIGRGLLVAIAGWVLAQALIRVPHLLLNALLMVKYQTVLLTVALAVAFALKFALAGRLGAGGILWGTTLSLALIFLPAVLWRIARWAKHSKAEGLPA